MLALVPVRGVRTWRKEGVVSLRCWVGEKERGREAGGRGESLGVTSKVIHALPEARPLKNIPSMRVTTPGFKV